MGSVSSLVFFLPQPPAFYALWQQTRLPRIVFFAILYGSKLPKIAFFFPEEYGGELGESPNEVLVLATTATTTTKWR